MAKNVFISWSGKTSHKFALALHDWLPDVIQAIEPYMSSEDTRKGTRWFQDIHEMLQIINFGILCITTENIHADWILFEAGALSKLGSSRVSPILINVKNPDLAGSPLMHFNTTSVSKDEFKKLLISINESLGEKGLPERKLEKAFEIAWPRFETQLNDLIPDTSTEEETTDNDANMLFEDRDFELLEAAYLYTMTTDSEYIDTEKFAHSEYGSKFDHTKLLHDLRFLFQEGLLEGADGLEYVSKRFRLSPTVFNYFASQIEQDYKAVQKNAIKAMVSQGDGITFDELAKKIEKNPVWTLLLMRYFDYIGWMHWDIRDGRSMYTIITPRGRRAAE